MTNLKKVNTNLLLSMESCKAKGYFESLGLNYSKGKGYAISLRLKELFNVIDFNADETEISKKLHQLLEDELFISKQQKEEEIQLLTQQLVRFLLYEKSRNTKILNRGVIGEVVIQGQPISVSADFVFDRHNYLEIVKVKRSEPSLSYAGRKIETKPAFSIELFLLSQLGKQLFPGKNIVASLYHLKGKDDKKSQQLPEFEVKKGKNIISHQFVPSQEEIVEQRIKNLLNEDYQFHSERTSDSSKCELCSFKNICKYEKSKSELEEVSEVKKADGKIQLTESQFKAVSFRNGVARINAGAGSGKTTVLALRVVELLQEGVKPQDILLITFTNKGAQEMREKISFWLKQMGMSYVDVSKMDILTFNAWGEKVIRNEYSIFGYQEAPTLIEKSQKYDIIINILDKNEKMEEFDYKNPLLDFPKAKGVVVQIAEYFDEIKSQFVLNPEDCASKLGIMPSIAKRIYSLFEQYNEQLKQLNLLDYQDQINHLVYLVEHHPEILEKYSYEHIMVDEFQDTNTKQLDIILELYNNEKVKSLMVVGDDSQAIYGFNHATQEIILKFHQYVEDVEDIYFVENFRSTPQIIKVANLLNGLNKHKIDKTLVSKASDGEKPKLMAFNTQQDEYKAIANMIKEKLDNGIAPQNIAVIARTRSELINIEKYLAEHNIPTVLDVSDKLINYPNIQIMISLVDFFENTELDFNLLEFLYIFQGDKIESMSPERIQLFVEILKAELIEEYESLQTEEEKINFYFKTIQPLAEQDVIVQGFVEELKEKNFKTVHDLFSYLKKLVLFNDDKQVVKKDVTYKAVVLITAHSSKGKEYDIVFNTIDNFNYNNIEEKELEEERRLLFVAVTRARKELYITYHQNMDRVKIKGAYCKFADELQAVERIS